MRGRWSLAILGVVLILAGGLLAHFTQTAGGIRIEDVRFKGAKGNTMSALLYIPPNATPQIPAPGILAVHGYINSRETQDGFAIEFARRGYVVLALDQTGHGYSDPPAFANGFGGPDALAHLRSLAIVDKNNIGLEGHSMGGWTVLAAANSKSNEPLLNTARKRHATSAGRHVPRQGRRRAAPAATMCLATHRAA